MELTIAELWERAAIAQRDGDMDAYTRHTTELNNRHANGPCNIPDCECYVNIPTLLWRVVDAAENSTIVASDGKIVLANIQRCLAYYIAALHNESMEAQTED